MEKFANEKNSINELVTAMESGDKAKMQAAADTFYDEVAARAAMKVAADFEEFKGNHEAAILAQRGYRQLTPKETKWYQKVINALKSSNAQQAFTAIIGSENEDDLMPTTIIEDVYKNLKEEHPLLSAIQFHHVKYATKWIMNDHAAQKAVWGTVTAQITEEIQSSFKVVDIKQNKLSAYVVIENGMLDLGPVFLDGYIRAVLTEALACGMEYAIVNGTGVNMPIGLIKDIHEGVTFNSSTGYPNKATVALKSFNAKDYGAVLATMATTENGKKRKFTSVGLIVNQNDYLTKVMPATSVLNTAGVWVRDLFAFPTKVYVSNEIDDGKAVLFLEKEYFFGAGGAKNGVIEKSEEYKFLEDQTVFKIKQYGEGRAYDNTCAVYLDISGLEPAYITVKNAGTVTA